MTDQPTAMARPGAALAALVQQVKQYCSASTANSTRRAYIADLKDYRSFCAANGMAAIPSTEVGNCLYIADLASRATVSTIRRRLAAIAYADHYEAGLRDSAATLRNSPQLRRVYLGIRRVLGTRQHGKDPLFTNQVAALMEAADPARLIGLRNRSMLALGYAGAFRREELAGLRYADCRLTEAGLVVTLNRGSKADQERTGSDRVAIPYGQNPETCPVRAFLAWTQAAGICKDADYLYQAVDCAGRLSGRPLHPRSIPKILKRLYGEAGVDATNLGAHSLRVGMVTQAARNGASATEIARITRHRRLAMVERYVREADQWRANASARLGL